MVTSKILNSSEKRSVLLQFLSNFRMKYFVADLKVTSTSHVPVAFTYSQMSVHQASVSKAGSGADLLHLQLADY